MSHIPLLLLSLRSWNERLPTREERRWLHESLREGEHPVALRGCGGESGVGGQRAVPALRSSVQGFGSRGQNPVPPGLCRALLLKQRVPVEQGKDRKLASVPRCLSENL